MKLQFYSLPIILIICLFAGKLTAQAYVDMALYNEPVNSNKLELRLRPTQNVTNLNFSAGVVTVRFPSALNGVLSVFSSTYGYGIAVTGLNVGGYDYYALQFSGQNFVTWTAGQEYVAAVLQFSNGPAVGGFELITGVTWTNDNNANFYIELDGQPRQGIFYQPASIISGNIEWYNGAPSGTGVKDATVNLTVAATGSDLTDVNGDYAISYATSGNITITPVKNINKANGLTVADAMAIQQHIAGITPITDPYRLVAADVNKTNSITTFDATIINQLLLLNPSAPAQFKTSWRFVPQSYALSIPPWGFPEKIDLIGASGNQPNKDFYGIKTGDLVTSFANPANLAPTPPLVLRTKDEALVAGSEVIAEFSADQFNDLAALQFALQFDPEKLQFIEIQPLAALPLTADHFGMYKIAEGEIRAVWSQSTGLFLDEGVGVFRIKFTVLESGGKLSDALYLNDTALPAYAYSSTLTESEIQMEFYEVTGTSPNVGMAEYRLLQNMPNPVTDKTTIGFVLPGACDASLRVFDASGRLLREHLAYYPAGTNAVEIELYDVQTGVLYYALTTQFGVLVKKMAMARE